MNTTLRAGSGASIETLPMSTTIGSRAKLSVSRTSADVSGLTRKAFRSRDGLSYALRCDPTVSLVRLSLRRSTTIPTFFFTVPLMKPRMLVLPVCGLRDPNNSALFAAQEFENALRVQSVSGLAVLHQLTHTRGDCLTPGDDSFPIRPSRRA